MVEMSPLAWLATYVFFVSMMLSVGLEVTAREVLGTLRSFRLLGRALLANLVLVPILGILVVRLFPLSPDVATGLLIMAAAPGAPFAVQFTTRAKDAVAFAAALMFLLTLSAVVVTPPLAGLLLQAETPLRLPMGRVARAVGLYALLPLLVGFALQRWAGPVAAKLRRPAGWIAAVSFPAAIVLTMAAKSAAMRTLGAPALAAILGLVLGGMLIGWLLGGPETGTRRVLATSTSMRNVMVGLLVALSSFPDRHVDLAVLAFSALMIPPNLVFTIYQDWRARRRERGSSSPVATRGR